MRVFWEIVCVAGACRVRSAWLRQIAYAKRKDGRVGGKENDTSIGGNDSGFIDSTVQLG